MGIDKIRLGPKSRYASPPVDKVEPGELVAHPPVPGPANPTSLRGCGCAKFHIPNTLDFIEVDGIRHWHSRTCRPVKGAATPEPAPEPGQRNVLDDLVTMLRERSDFGLRKYGTRLETFNGRDAHLDAMQELLDLFVYLQQAQMERAELEARIRSTVTGWKFCPWCGKPVPEAARCLCPGWSLGKRGAL